MTPIFRSAAFATVAFAAIGLAACDSSAQTTQPKAAQTGARASAIFAGGCFWCTEKDFDQMPGVIATESGYTGGRTPRPTYDQVSAGGTGHIEAVRVTYDPARISYATLVSRFLRTIDPLDGGGQFCDRGPQYQSAVFVGNAAERQAAAAARDAAARAVKVQGRIATSILNRATFYPAEAYHQDYYKKNPARYRFYRFSCGRDARLGKVWG